MATKIVFKNEFGRYSAEINKEEATLDEVFEYLVDPVLRAAGYDPDNIRKWKETPDVRKLIF